MDEHVNLIRDACQKYIEAANAVLAEFNSSGSLRTEAADMAQEKLKEQYKHFHSVCDKTEGSVAMMTQPVKELNPDPTCMFSYCAC
jgi:hypothetical protein